jgi:thioesterase domain-containing protein
MATRYVEALREVRPHGPYRLGGWSSGGVVAFEMARQLERAGETVERVALLDTPSPALHALPGERALLDWFIEDLDIGIDAAGASRLPIPERGAPEELLAAALAQLGERASRIGLDARQLSPVFDVFRSVVTACRNYGGDPIAADLLVLRASQGRVTEFMKHPADAEADWGWRHFTRGRVLTGAVPGTHYTVLAPSNLPVLVGHLDAPPGNAPTSIQRDG